MENLLLVELQKEKEQRGIGKMYRNGICKTPGMKIRSKGFGKGLARGKGRGPIGIPISKKGFLPKPKIGNFRNLGF